MRWQSQNKHTLVACSITTFSSHNEDNLIDVMGPDSTVMEIPRLHYNSIQHLVEEVNQLFEELEVPCNLFLQCIKRQNQFPSWEHIYHFNKSEIFGDPRV